MRILITNQSVATPDTSDAQSQAPASGVGRSHERREGDSIVSRITIAFDGQSGEDCACAEFDLHDHPELAANVLDSLGIALLNRGCLDEGGPLVEKARLIRREFLGQDHPAMAASQNSYARLRRERGDYKAAEEAARDALRINRDVFGTKSLAVANSLYQLANTQLDKGDFKAAHRSSSKGLEIMKALGPAANDPNATRLLEIRGRAELNLGDAPVAAATYMELLDRDVEELGTREHYKYVTHAANFGMVQEALDKPELAERAYREAIAFFVQRFKRPCHPNLIDVYANLGSLLRERTGHKADEESGAFFRKALELDQKVRGEDHVLVANDHANLGRWQYDTKEVDQAVASFGKAIEIYEQNVKEGELPPEHFFIAEARTWKGRILVEGGGRERAALARPELELAVAHWPAQLSAGNLGEGIAKACLGHALFLLGKERDRACELLCEGYEIVKNKCPDKDFVERVKDWIDAQGCHCDKC